MSVRMLVIPILALALACHSGQSGEPDEQLQAAPTYLTVANQGFTDMDIYVLPQSGGRVRLGTSTGNTTSSMRIPDYLVATPINLRFLCSPIGGSRSPVSQSISVQPGDNVELQIPPG